MARITPWLLVIGAGLSESAIVSTVRRWVMWSRVRIAVSFIAWCAALHALALS